MVRSMDNVRKGVKRGNVNVSEAKVSKTDNALEAYQ